MASPQRPDEQGSLEDLLRKAESPVRYDVEQGYARHQHLLASGASLPDWASEVPAGGNSTFLRRWGAWLGAGFLLGVVATWSATRESRTAQSPTGGVLLAREHARFDADQPADPIGAAPRKSPAAANAPSRASGPEQAAPDGPRAYDEPTPGTPVVEPLVIGASEPGPQPASTQANADTEEALGAAPKAIGVERAELDGVPLAQPLVPPMVEARVLAREQNKAGSRTASPHASNRVDAQGPMDREEVLQLAQAEQLLISNPSAAIDLVRRGNTQFKRGYLQHERRYIEVMALFAAGRTSEGEARAQWFLRDYRTSPYREKVQRAVAQHASP